jgi:hypothetical protein
MGIVYRARDRETGELVALKVLKPEIAADAGIVERFKNELRLARKITHKNVCRIHEFNRAPDGTAYISMEFVEGESLRRVLSRFGNLGVCGGTRIAQQICAGLREAHAQNVVHRDLKPENVMVDREGTVKVMDFGIARSLEAGTTGTTGIMGTPAYMAPEQAEGKAVDPRADIYALGLILYELFTGSTAFKGDTPMAVALKQIHETPPAPREVEPALPAHVEKAILKCLEKNPAKRFQSVDELEAALTREPEAKPMAVEVAADAPLPVQLTRWQRSDYILLGGAFLSLVVSLVLWDRVFPFSTVNFMEQGKAEKAVKDVLAKLEVNAGPENGKPWLAVQDYPGLVEAIGPEAAHRYLEQGGASNWEFEIAGPEVPRVAGKATGGVNIDQTGKVAWLGFRTRPKSLAIELTPQKIRELAVKVFSTAFALDVSRIEPRVTFPVPGAWECKYVMTDPSSGLNKEYRLGSAGSGMSASVWTQWWGRCEEVIPVRGSVALFLLTLFASALFFLRRLHRLPISRASLMMALFSTTLAFVAFNDLIISMAEDFLALLGISRALWAGLPREWATVLNVVLNIPPFLLIWAATYFILSVGMYYGRRNDPTRVRTYCEILEHPLKNQAGGLAVLRGLFLGFVFVAVFAVLLALAERARWFGPIVGASSVVRGLREYWESTLTPSVLLLALRALTVPILEAFVLVWLLIALPTSLLRRVVSQVPLLLGVMAGIWLIVGYPLQGARACTVGGFYLTLTLQGLFLSAVYLRWDLLTAMSAVSTIESWLIGYAAQQMFHDTYSSLYGLPLMVFIAFVLLGSYLYFRPQLGGAYRRVAAVFE